jgi:O-methyltransferase
MNINKKHTQNIINDLLDNTPIISNMVTHSQVSHILNHLSIVLEENIRGEIIELGCNVGTTSIFIRKLLDHYNSDKTYHVYDSFEGLPNKAKEDENQVERKYNTGSCKTSLEVYLKNFNHFNLKKPYINVGWFIDIDNKNYPDNIAFAFFDGDFYTSIIDSFEKVYHKLTPGSRVLIHDYAWDALPGVKKACDEFLYDKPENVILLEIGIGLLIKD